MTVLWLDLESYSEADLKKVGTHRYCADDSTEVIVAQWAIDDGEPQVWDCTVGDYIDEALTWKLLDPTVTVVAHNSAFDRTLLRHVWGIDVPVERWLDTMVQAMAHGLPGSLDKLSGILGLEADEAKDKRGRELIQLFCKPRPKGHKLRRATSATHPNEWAEFLEYSRMDIVAMRAVHRRLPRWNYAPGHPELALWHLDQRCNDRGFAVDVGLAHAAIEAVADEQARLKAEITDNTDGAVTNASQRDELLSYILLEHGVSLPDMRADTLERRARDPELPEAVRRLLEIRLEATKTSTAKYRALVNAVSADGRLRNTMQFCGAQRTGRVAHRLFQPGNMPRPSPGFDGEAQEEAIAALKAGVADIAFNNVMRLTSDCIRGTIIAPPGRKLVVADLSNIEGRVLAFLASEQWKLEAFRAFDRGEGADIYKLAYAKSFGTSPDKVDKQQRQIGKVQELMLGYEGGVGAYLTGAATYGFDVADLAEAVHRATPAATWGSTLESFEWFKKKGLTYGLPVEHWAACRVLVDSWREAHAKTKELWHGLKDAYAAAVNRPGETFSAGRWLRVRRDGAWLRIRLPSGRYLCYLQPEVDDSGQCSYMGINQYTRQWARIKTHGGKLAENCLAGDTEVLTDTGWRRLDSITNQRVWDGEEWAAHGGLHYSGKQSTILAFGVRMTPDHRVLTTEGWRDASSCARLDRLHCRLPNADDLCWVGRDEVAVEREVRVRQDNHDSRDRGSEAAEARHPRIVRLHASRHHLGEADDPRDVAAPGLCRVAQHDRPLRAAVASGLAQLRRAGDRCLRGVAWVVRGLLARHGADLPARPDLGAQGQQRGLQRGQLHLGDREAAGQQHPAFARDRDAGRQDDSDAGFGSLRHRLQHAAVPTGPRLAGDARVEPVFDLLNCGPRQRFTVRGPDGVPFIVHNCTQAVARDVLFANMLQIEVAGYAILVSIHDELLTETPGTDEYSHARLAELMSIVPPWAPGLPLAAAGFETTRYRKE